MVITMPLWIALATRGLRRDVRSTQALAHRAATSAAAAEHEVKPNSGASMADSVHRSESALGGLSEAIALLSEGIERLEQGQRETARDIGGLREEQRTERRERGRTDERLAHAVEERDRKIDSLRADLPHLIEQHVHDCPLRTHKETS